MNYPQGNVRIKGIKAFLSGVRVGVKIEGLHIESPNRIVEIGNVNLKLNPIGVIPFLKVPLLYFDINFSDLKSLFGETSNSSISIKEFNEFLNANKKNLKKVGVLFKNNRLTFNNAQGIQNIVYVEEAKIFPLIKENNVKYKMRLKTKVNGSLFNTVFILETSPSFDKLILTGTLEEIDQEVLLAFGLIDQELFRNVKLKIFGALSLVTQDLKNIDLLNFDIKAREISFENRNWYDLPILLDAIDLKGSCKDNCRSVEVKEFIASSNNKVLAGHVSYDDKSLKGDLNTSALCLKTILSFWPKTAAQDTKNWIEKHITEAEFEKSFIYFDLNLDEIKRIGEIPAAQLKITAPLKKASVIYPEKYPVIKINRARLFFGGTDYIKIRIDDGRLLDSKLHDLNIDILKLRDPITPLIIRGKLEGSAQTAIDTAFIYMKKPNHELKDLIGKSVVDLDIKVPLSKSLTFDDVKLNIFAHLTELASDKLFGKYEFNKGNIKINVKEQKASIEGTALYRKTIPITIKRTQNIKYDPYNPKDATTQITSKIELDKLKNMGFYPSELLNGKSIKATLTFQRIGDSLQFDLTDNEITIPILSYKKAANAKASLTLPIKQFEPEILFDSYSLDLPGLKSSGTVVFKKGIDSLKSDNTFFYNNRLSLLYKRHPEINYVLVIGNELDFSSVSISEILKSDQKEFKNSFLIEIKANALKLKNQESLRDFKTKIKYIKGECSSIDLNSDIFGLKRDKSKLHITSNQAANIISAFDISKNLDKGRMSFDGIYNLDNSLDGKLIVENFNLTHAPILVRIANLTSITLGYGFIEMLKKGVSFSRLECGIHYKNGLIKLNECIQKGKILNLLYDGAIDLNSNRIKVDGQFIPANIINTIVKNIPFMGKFISGGDDSGAIGVNFWIYGDLNNPKIGANPLSIITPGILRKIF